jgi:hypothetical protein
MIFLHNSVFSQTIDTIKFESFLDLIKIPIQINGKVHTFLFDTGAEGSVIREDIAKELDKAKCTTDTLHDTFNNKIPQLKYIVDSVKIGNSNFYNFPITTFPKSSMFTCLGAEGVIGIDIISQFDWLIDFQNHSISKIDTGYLMSGMNDYITLDFYKIELRPRIKLKFDSGANKNDLDSIDYGLIKNKVLKSFDIITNSSGITGDERQVKEKIILINTEPDNANKKFYNAEFHTISIGESKLGNTYWGSNKLFLSWSKNKLLFKLTTNTLKNTFGIKFKIINDTITVNSLVYTEQILISGLKVGDKIKTLNDKYFKDYCDLITYQINEQYDLLVVELLNGKKIKLVKENKY